MLRLSLLIATLLTLLPAARAQADDLSHGVLTPVRPYNTFIPNGFDNNDNVEVVLDGYLPNTCYRMAHTQVSRVPDTNTIKITQWARVFPGLCLQIVLPYSVEVPLGQLEAGDYVVDPYGAPPFPLHVAESSGAGVDDYLYAPVDTAYVERDRGKYWVIFQGRFTNNCMRWKDVRVTNSGKTIEVLPIVEMADGDHCRAQEIPYSWRAYLPDDMAEGRHLVHVRSLNGKAVNAVFSVDPLQTRP